MIGLYQVVSVFFTLIRFLLCLCIMAKLMDFAALWRSMAIYSLAGAGIVTALSMFQPSQFCLAGTEIALFFLASQLLYWDNPRICLFLAFFCEVSFAQWDFIASAGLKVLSGSDELTPLESMAAVLIVRLLMLGAGVFIIKGKQLAYKRAFRVLSMCAVSGLLGVITLSEQHIVVLDDDLLTTWIILSLIWVFALMVFNMRRQYEMEREISDLKAEQAELLEHDYQSLSRTYAANAKLYHDLHNHLEVMYRGLMCGKNAEVIQYIKDLRGPVQELSQASWTGDGVVDYLISSKLALAEREGIKTEVYAEIPRNTNIRGADLTAVLGNLLDNAIEASQKCKDVLRFITLTMRRINNMIVIKVENGCEELPRRENGGFQSAKTDKRLHGWGLKSVKAAAERYDGTVDAVFEDNIFRVVVTLCYDVAGSGNI